MAYRIERNKETGKNEIVIDGWENGIADSPHEGIANLQNANIVSIPGEALVNFATQAMTVPITVSAAAFTATAATDIFTWTATGTLYTGTAIQLNTTSAGGTSTGVVYYVGNVSGNTFKIYSTIAGVNGAVTGTTPVNVSSDGAGTFSTYTLGNPTHSAIDYLSTFNFISAGFRAAASYMIDSRNQVWLLIPDTSNISALSGYPSQSLIFVGNIGSTINTGVNSIAVWKSYLFVFRQGNTDYWHINLSATPASRWVYSWPPYQPTSTVSLRSLVGQDDAIYICNDSEVDSILEIDGETFDPTDPTTYTVNMPALLLPTDDTALCLAELGVNLLVGGRKSYVYPWDRVSTSYSYPIVVPEPNISLIVSTNSNAYIFAGVRGRIYYTNGSAIDLYKKIPDHLSSLIDPYYVTGGADAVGSSLNVLRADYGDAIYWRNQLIFSFVTISNSGTIQDILVGLWAIDLKSNSIRLLNLLSYGSYSGRAHTIIPNLASPTPGGGGLFTGWSQTNGTPGVDISTSIPYTNFQTVIETDIIPVGTLYQKETFSQIEFKLAVPMVTNESVRVSQRTNLSDSYTVIGTTTATVLSDLYPVNFEGVQWTQYKIESSSTSSSPSFTRLSELRIR